MNNEIQLKEKVELLKGEIEILTVTNKEEEIKAHEYIKKVREAVKVVKNHFKDMKEAAHKAWKTICEKEKDYLDNLTYIDKSITKKISDYTIEQERIQRELERKAEEERIEREKKEQEKLLKQAERAEKKGDIEKAERLADQATEFFEPPTIIEPLVEKTVKTENATSSKIKDFDIVIKDLKMIVDAVSDGLLPISIIGVNESKIKLWAKSMNIDNYNQNGLVITSKYRLAVR